MPPYRLFFKQIQSFNLNSADYQRAMQPGTRYRPRSTLRHFVKLFGFEMSYKINNEQIDRRKPNDKDTKMWREDKIANCH